MMENPVRCKYACARVLLRMHACLKKKAYQLKMQKSVALIGSHFLGRKKGNMFICTMQIIDISHFYVDLRGRP